MFDFRYLLPQYFEIKGEGATLKASPLDNSHAELSISLNMVEFALVSASHQKATRAG